MPSNFPTGPDNIQNNVANSTLEVDLHPSLHNKLADAVNAVETALLTGGSMNLAAHVAAADPHTGYLTSASADALFLTQTEGDARYATIAGAVPDGSITSAKIADGTIVAGDIADGAVTSAKILDGTIATADLANSAVTNAKLASDTARANLLPNGGFEIWQRGNGPFTVQPFNADRWQLGIAAGDTFSVSRDSANVDTGSQYCAAVTYGRSTGGSNLNQTLTGERYSLLGRTLSLSMRVRTSTANAVRVGIYNGTAWAYSTYHSGGGTYETLTSTLAIPTGASSLIPAVIFDQSCTAYLDNATLVVGGVPAEYAPLHPADDLARCLRYYETTATGSGVGWPTLAAYGAASQVYRLPMNFAAKKAVTPTITIGAAGAWSLTNCGAPFSGAASVDGHVLQTTVTALGAFMFGPALGTATITAESNP